MRYIYEKLKKELLGANAGIIGLPQVEFMISHDMDLYVSYMRDDDSIPDGAYRDIIEDLRTLSAILALIRALKGMIASREELEAIQAMSDAWWARWGKAVLGLWHDGAYWPDIHYLDAHIKILLGILDTIHDAYMEGLTHAV